MFKRRYARGLRIIPDYILENVSEEVLTVLRKDGHGLSFPDKTFCQVRIKRGKTTYSACFTYSKYNTIEDTVRAGMFWFSETYQKLDEVGENRRVGKGKGGVYYIKRPDRRNGNMTHAHVVYYTNPETGKRRSKTFYHKTGDTPPTPGQLLHGHRTALYFLAEQERIEVQHGTCIRHETFYNWKSVRHYVDGRPLVDYKTL